MENAAIRSSICVSNKHKFLLQQKIPFVFSALSGGTDSVAAGLSIHNTCFIHVFYEQTTRMRTVSIE